MSSECNFFKSHIATLYTLESLYSYISNSAPTMDASVLLRSEYVLIVSAFDHYVHQIVRRNIVNNFFSPSGTEIKLPIPFDIVQKIVSESDNNVQREILNVEVRKILSKDSYQSPKAVEYALSLIGIKKIWSSIADTMGDAPEHIRNTLALIALRRNKIAHEADINISTGELADIDIETVHDCCEFLGKLVDSIDILVGS